MVNTLPQSWLLEKSCCDDLDRTESEENIANDEEMASLICNFLGLQSKQYFVNYFIEARKDAKQWPDHQTVVDGLRNQHGLLRNEEKAVRLESNKLYELIDEVTDKTEGESQSIEEAKKLSAEVSQYDHIKTSYESILKPKSISAENFGQSLAQQVMICMLTCVPLRSVFY